MKRLVSQKRNEWSGQPKFADYESWESYISKNFIDYTAAKYRSNFSFFLREEYRFARDYIDSVKTVVFPGLITVIPALYDNAALGLIIAIFIILYSIIETSTSEIKRDFIIDITKILLPNDSLE